MFMVIRPLGFSVVIIIVVVGDFDPLSVCISTSIISFAVDGSAGTRALSFDFARFPFCFGLSPSLLLFLACCSYVPFVLAILIVFVVAIFIIIISPLLISRQNHS